MPLDRSLAMNRIAAVSYTHLRFVAVHPDVYVPLGTTLTASTRARAAWLWSRRRGTVAGRSASALHCAKWIDDSGPAELLYENRYPPTGIHTWSDRIIEDEVQLIGEVTATTPARTAFDLACRNPTAKAVAMIDALARTTRLNVEDVQFLAERYKGCLLYTSLELRIVRCPAGIARG